MNTLHTKYPNGLNYYPYCIINYCNMELLYFNTKTQNTTR